MLRAYDGTPVPAEKSRYILLLGLSLLLSAFLRLPYFQYDFIFVDEAWWANGAKVLCQGGRLYVDIALDKNPPIFWFCALLFKLFGIKMIVIHAGALLLVCMTSGLLFVLGARYFSAAAGGLAAVIHAVASTTYYIPRIIGMNTETLMVVFSSCAAFCYLNGLLRESRFSFCLAGSLASLAFLTKPVAITEMAVLVLFLIVAGNGNLISRFRSLLALLAGFALALGLFLGYLAHTGVLWAWLDQAILYGFRYVGQVGSEAFITKSFRASAGFGLIFAWLFLLIWYSRGTRRENARAHTFLVCWLLGAFAGVVLGRRYYANYFIQIIPPLSLLGGIGLTHLWKSRNQGSVHFIKWICCAAFLISFFWFHSRTLANWGALASSRFQQMKVWNMWEENRKNLNIAAHLRRGTSANESIFVWGSNAQLFFLAQRSMATPWMDFDVVNDYPPRAAELPIQERMAEQLARAKPGYIIDVQRIARLESFPCFRKLVKEYYDLDSQIAGVLLYKLREAGPLNGVQGIAANLAPVKIPE